jgi:hypothetical protein
MRRLAAALALHLVAVPAFAQFKPADDACPDSVDGLCFHPNGGANAASVARAQIVVAQMLRHAPTIKQRMTAARFRIEIIGRNQVISDLALYSSLRGRKTFDGRSFDTGTRGLGGRDVCSVGEENLLCLPKQNYWQEDILVHEFAHSIKEHLDTELSTKIDAAYTNAKAHKLYALDIYMMANSQEYWAEGSQAWFNATTRTDVNGGINTREALLAHDPALASLMEQVYGTETIHPIDGCRY